MSNDCRVRQRGNKDGSYILSETVGNTLKSGGRACGTPCHECGYRDQPGTQPKYGDIDSASSATIHDFAHRCARPSRTPTIRRSKMVPPGRPKLTSLSMALILQIFKNIHGQFWPEWASSGSGPVASNHHIGHTSSDIRVAII